MKKKLPICFILVFILSTIPVYAQAPDLPYRIGNLIPKNNFVLKHVVKNESNGNPEAYNPKDTDGRAKYGILQMGWNEFYTWASWAGIAVKKVEESKPKDSKCSMEFNPDICNPVKQLTIWHWLSKNKPEYLRKWGTFARLFP